jgi:hypothetical protein
MKIIFEKDNIDSVYPNITAIPNISFPDTLLFMAWCWVALDLKKKLSEPDDSELRIKITKDGRQPSFKNLSKAFEIMFIAYVSVK